MKEEIKMSRTKQIYFSVLGVLAFIAIVVGASYAYLSAQTVSGNTSTNNITTSIAKYGTLTVAYHGTNGSIGLTAQDLPKSANGATYTAFMKFTVTASSDQTVQTKYNINWAGTSRVTNTFSQTNSTVRNEATYAVYECSAAGYPTATASSLSACTTVIKESAPLPYSDAEKTGTILANKAITGNTTHYYIMVVSLQNLADTVQDYQAGAAFQGAIAVQSLTN